MPQWHGVYDTFQSHHVTNKVCNLKTIAWLKKFTDICFYLSNILVERKGNKQRSCSLEKPGGEAEDATRKTATSEWESNYHRWDTPAGSRYT